MESHALTVPGTDRLDHRVELVQRYAPPATAVAALLALMWGMLTDYAPAGELRLIGAPVLLGLLLEPVALRLLGRGVRLAQSIGASTSLCILILWLPAPPDRQRELAVQLFLVVFLLGFGLVSGPLLRIIRFRPGRGDFPAAAAFVSVTLMLGRLITDFHGFDIDPLGPLRCILVGSLVVMAASQLTDLPRLRQTVQPSVALIALIWLLVTLGNHPGISPRWPVTTIAVLGILGLIAELLVWLLARAGVAVLTQRVDQLSRSRRDVLDVQANELRRIERDLHDGAQVRLVALSLKLGRAEDRYRDDPEAAALIREAREDATAAIRELRELARGIAPPVLANRGLTAAVQSIAQRAGTDVTVTSRLTERPGPAAERAAYFVVAESLANATKHAEDARVEIELSERGDDLFIEITDFGPGGADANGNGLTGLRQRVEALDGTLTITSPDGVGTHIEAVLPCVR